MTMLANPSRFVQEATRHARPSPSATTSHRRENDAAVLRSLLLDVLGVTVTIDSIDRREWPVTAQTLKRRFRVWEDRRSQARLVMRGYCPDCDQRAWSVPIESRVHFGQLLLKFSTCTQHQCSHRRSGR